MSFLGAGRGLLAIFTAGFELFTLEFPLTGLELAFTELELTFVFTVAELALVELTWGIAKVVGDSGDDVRKLGRLAM